MDYVHGDTNRLASEFVEHGRVKCVDQAMRNLPTQTDMPIVSLVSITFHPMEEIHT